MLRIKYKTSITPEFIFFYAIEVSLSYIRFSFLHNCKNLNIINVPLSQDVSASFIFNVYVVDELVGSGNITDIEVCSYVDNELSIVHGSGNLDIMSSGDRAFVYTDSYSTEGTTTLDIMFRAVGYSDAVDMSVVGISTLYCFLESNSNERTYEVDVNFTEFL